MGKMFNAVFELESNKMFLLVISEPLMDGVGRVPPYAAIRNPKDEK